MLGGISYIQLAKFMQVTVVIVTKYELFQNPK